MFYVKKGIDMWTTKLVFS